MSASHPRPHRAWAQQILTLLVATCLTVLAVSAGAAARTTKPTATISSAALRSAIAARTADKRTLAHDSARLNCFCVDSRLVLRDVAPKHAMPEARLSQGVPGLGKIRAAKNADVAIREARMLQVRLGRLGMFRCVK